MSADRVWGWLFGWTQGRQSELLRASGTEGHKPLGVLSRGDHEGLGVHLLQSPQPELPRSVPFLGLPKEWLYPHRAFAQGLAVGLGVAVRPHPFEVLLVEAATDPAPLRAVRALALQGALLAGGRPHGVPDVPSPTIVALTAQGLAAGAGVEVLLGVVDEVLYGEQAGAPTLLGQLGVGADTRLLYGICAPERPISRAPATRASKRPAQARRPYFW